MYGTTPMHAPTMPVAANLEVGIVTAHPVVYAWRMLLTIWRTWRYARKNGLVTNRWYGVYERGTENVVAHFGCMPGAEVRARKFISSTYS